MLFSTISLLLAIAVSALPNGAPKCAINATVIAAGHGTPPDGSAGFSLAVDNSVINGPITVTITNNASRTSFKGILLYINGADKKYHMGQFVKIDESLFKYQTAICENLGFKGDAQSTITHANPKVKLLKSVSFTWIPLAGDEKMQGPFAVHAAIATEPVPWMVADPVPVTFNPSFVPAPAAAAAPATAAAPASQDALKQPKSELKYKCKRKSSK